MNARFIAIALLIGAVAVAAEHNCNVPGFFESYCQRGGVCHDSGAAGNHGYGAPTCLCPTPSIGSDCSGVVRECRDSPCGSGATCQNQPSTGCSATTNWDCFECACPPQWGAPSNWPGNAGGICNWPKPPAPCDYTPCANGGTCTNDNTITGGYTCACTFTGYYGRNCTFNCTKNAADVCLNGGTCNLAGCVCANGYSGWDCSVPPFCLNSPCQNAATCANGLGGTGTCTCAPGFSGKFCSVSAFCTANPTACGSGGTCRNVPSDVGGQGYCDCPPGFASGPTVFNCTQQTFCGASPCQNSATCVPNGNGGSCSCATGFAGRYCEVVLATTKVCYNKVAVVNKECFNGACPCMDQASCNTNNWKLGCTCKDATAAPYLNYADCRCNSTYVPRCPTPSQGAATIIDLPCQNGGSCAEHATGWGCTCRPGFYGARCESYHNPCGSSPCQNGGKCNIMTETASSFAVTENYWTHECECKYPYTGRECQTRVEDPANVCLTTSPLPTCENGGSCVPRPYNFAYGSSPKGGGGWFRNVRIGGRYGRVVRQWVTPWVCQCPTGFIGDRCEYAYNPTSLICGVNWPPNNPDGTFTCQGGGRCIQESTGGFDTPRCACRCGFSGEYCEIRANAVSATDAAEFIDNYGRTMDFCGTNMCQNGGSCVTSVDWQNAHCLCAAGYYGYYCQYQGLAAGANVLPSAIVVAAAAIVAAALRM